MEQGQYHEAIKERSEQLDLILDTTPVFISYVGADLHYRFVSRSAAKALGRVPAEMIGKHVRDILGAADFDRIAPRLDAVWKGQEVCVEFPLHFPELGPQFVRAHYIPHIGANGEVAGIMTYILNLTEHKRMEEELRQAQKMEAVGRLAGGIAHDFNNLLTVINGFAEMAQSSLAEADTGKTAAMLQEVQKSGERAAGLTRQLLAYSRKQILFLKSVDTNEMVQGMGTMLHRLIREDIEFSTVLAPGLKPIRMDAGQFEQIVLNLVLNACDAMHAGGKLKVETAQADLGAEGRAGLPSRLRGTYVTLSVCDTGSGMSPEIRQRIFEPYYTTKGPGKGTGLGLATVHGILEQCGGHIQVSSEPGKGSAFTCWFPATEGESAPTGNGNETGAQTGKPAGRLVFLVEDEEAVRAYSRQVLEGLGYRVETAKSGTDAMEHLQGMDAPVDLLLTDVVMPGMNGPDLWDKVRRRDVRAKVVFMSGYADDPLADMGLLDAAAAYLQKPFTPSQLARKVGEAFSAAPKPLA
jgi:PAS domain S-box-containing protein